MDALDVMLTLSSPENLDLEEDIKDWSVEKIEINGDYYDFYNIYLHDGRGIEATVHAKEIGGIKNE